MGPVGKRQHMPGEENALLQTSVRNCFNQAVSPFRGHFHCPAPVTQCILDVYTETVLQKKCFYF